MMRSGHEYQIPCNHINNNIWTKNISHSPRCHGTHTCEQTRLVSDNTCHWTCLISHQWLLDNILHVKIQWETGANSWTEDMTLISLNWQITSDQIMIREGFKKGLTWSCTLSYNHIFDVDYLQPSARRACQSCWGMTTGCDNVDWSWQYDSWLFPHTRPCNNIFYWSLNISCCASVHQHVGLNLINVLTLQQVLWFSCTREIPCQEEEHHTAEPQSDTTNIFNGIFKDFFYGNTLKTRFEGSHCAH